MAWNDIIVMWSGAIADIPAGWYLCDGNNSTPDLRNEFLIGAGDSFNPDDSGAEPAHRHFFVSDGHTHNTRPGVPAPIPADSELDPNTLVAFTQYQLPIPPYFALAYIMHKGL